MAGLNRMTGTPWHVERYRSKVLNNRYEMGLCAELKPRERILYKRMGVQETQNCTVITLRMKHRRMRWSESGANNLAKALYRKENKELTETIDRYTDGLISTIQMQKIVETLSVAKTPQRDGKGNPHAERMIVHMPILDAVQTTSRKAFKKAFC